MAKRGRPTAARAAELNEMNKAGAEFLDILKQMKASLDAVKKGAGETGDELKEWTQSTREAENLAKQLSKATTDGLATAKKRAAFEQQLKRAKAEQAKIEQDIVDKLRQAEEHEKSKAPWSKINAKKQRDLAKTLNDQLQASKALTKEAAKYGALARKIDKASSFFRGFSDIVGDVPVIGKLFGEFADATKAASEAAADGAGTFSSFMAGLSSFAKGIAKAGLIFLISSLSKGIGLLETSVVGVSRALGTTGADAEKIFSRARGAAAQLGMPLEDALGSLVEFNQHLGTSANVSTETAKSIALIDKKMGLGADAAAGLYKYAASSGKSMKDVMDETVGATKQFNKLNKTIISPAKILQDVAGASAATALSTKKFPGGLAAAAAQARKLGTDLEKSEAAMSGMLDFETSINAEMEAEVLLGRQLNLEKARIAALNGDIKTFNEEIAKQGITAASFGKMNVLQQQALAEAFGMQREDLAARLKGEEAQKKLSEESAKNGVSQTEQILNAKEAGAALNTEIAGTVTTSESLSKIWETISLKLGDIANESGLIAMLQNGLKSVSEWLSTVDAETWGDNIKSTVQWLIDNWNTIKNTLIGIAGISIASKVWGMYKALSATLGLGQKLIGTMGKIPGANMADDAAKAAKGGGGWWGSIKKGFGNLKTGVANFAKDPIGSIKTQASKLNPKNLIGKNFSKILGRLMGPAAAAIEGILAYSDIKGMIASGQTGAELTQNIGRRSYGAIGSALGGIGGAALGTLIPIPVVGSMLGAWLGSMGGTKLMEYLGNEFDPGYMKLGNMVRELPLFEQVTAEAPTELATGGIVTGPTYAMIGEAGDEAVIPLSEFYSKFDELINVVKQGGDVIMDGRKVGTAMVMGASKLS